MRFCQSSVLPGRAALASASFLHRTRLRLRGLTVEKCCRWPCRSPSFQGRVRTVHPKWDGYKVLGTGLWTRPAWSPDGSRRRAPITTQWNCSRLKAYKSLYPGQDCFASHEVASKSRERLHRQSPVVGLFFRPVAFRSGGCRANRRASACRRAPR